MTDLSTQALAAGRVLRDALATPRLSASTARLYSQHVRLRSGQPGLTSFTADDLASHLRDAVRLVEASLLARTQGEAGWESGLRRAAELLEWMSHPELNSDGLPLTVLGAAAYQLAGYPARASCLARYRPFGERDSPLLRLLVTGNFNPLLLLAAQIAADDRVDDGALQSSGTPGIRPVDSVIAAELASALGVVCGALRWGEDARIDLARRKLEAVAPALRGFADPYSWLVVRLATEFGVRVLNGSLREALQPIGLRLGDQGRDALERYTRTAFAAKQILIWPSQQRGIDKLSAGRSFALCTPTGSGKTRVAEVALLEGLFQDPVIDGEPAGLCLYIVPTRALAAEVESKLGRILTLAGGARAVTVTSLYGGLDWGPTDEWLSLDVPTVLICTQEKAEALVRFLGGAFVERLKLVIVDEAHEVQFDGTNDDLARAESRALRLESLVTRLRARKPQATYIAISAVARHLERPLAQWISGGVEAESVSVPYRSTRQVVGRLHCRAGGGTRIEYDLLDGEPLNVANRDEAAFVPQPFPGMPRAPQLEGAQQIVAPFALWAAMQLAGSRAESDQTQTVLVSVTEGISNFTGWWLRLLTQIWVDTELPQFFSIPTDGPRRSRWDRTRATCEDLFGPESREFRLLNLGIVVHHGRMPGRLPRLLTDLVDEQIVRIVLATSTLSQGVNLPVQTVLIPRLDRFDRQTKSLRPVRGREFANLIGRAGRPGVATEGQALALIPDFGPLSNQRRTRRAYDSVIREMSVSDASAGTARSGLAELLALVAARWPGTDEDEFFTWLEQAAPADIARSNPGWNAAEALDALDAVILAAEADGAENDIELQLRHFWSESFARYAGDQEDLLEEILVRRGKALKATVYPDADVRRRYYMTSLPPMAAQALLDTSATIVEHLATGADYAQWDRAAQFAYIQTAIRLVSEISRFSIPERIGASNATWADALAWWLRMPELPRTPTVTQVAVWHDYLQRELRYRFTWGLGAVLAVALESNTEAASILDWDQAGVPWAAVWIKDLLTWGTMDPVAAYLLGRGGFDTRDSAEAATADYYEQHEGQGDPLDPALVRRWAQRFGRRTQETGGLDVSRIAVELDPRVQKSGGSHTWRVLPDLHGPSIRWLDPAGFELARSPRPIEWRRDWTLRYDWVLDPVESAVDARRYV